MSEQQDERPPDATEEPESVELGEPERARDEGERAMREEQRPDLDERHEQIATRRKPMGPPLKEPDDRGELEEGRPRERGGEPVDPEE